MIDIASLPEKEHCYSDYTLKEVVQMVSRSAERNGKTLNTLEEVRDYLKDLMSATDHVWITGERAYELIESEITGIDVKEIAVP